jgi:hypothetical protein
LAGGCAMVQTEFLSANAVDVYKLIVRGVPVPEGDADSVAELIARGFIVCDAASGNRPVALDPRQVERRRMDEMARETAERAARMAHLPVVADELARHFEQAQGRTPAGSEYIGDVAVVNARLDDVIGGARREILTAQPAGPRSRVQLNRSLERDTAALDRGVAKRTLYRATVRDNTVTARYARAMSGRTAGACGEFRTLVDPFERCIVVDESHAFISAHGVADAPPHAAWYITDPAAVAYIAASFHTAWTRARPWRGDIQASTDAAWSVDAVSGPRAGIRTSPPCSGPSCGTSSTGSRSRHHGATPGDFGLRTLGVEISRVEGTLFGAEFAAAVGVPVGVVSGPAGRRHRPHHRRRRGRGRGRGSGSLKRRPRSRVSRSGEGARGNAAPHPRQSASRPRRARTTGASSGAGSAGTPSPSPP